MEKVEYTIKVFDNFIEITPVNGVKDNSIYEIRIKDLKALDGSYTIESETIKFCTALTPSYVDIQAVQSLIDSTEIAEDKILYHIREASRFVDYIIKESRLRIDLKNDIPFEVTQFVKYKAAHECLLRFYIERASDGGTKGTLGDVTFENKETLPDIKGLLKSLKTEIKTWEDAVKGFKLEGRIRPRSAIKSSKGTVGTPPVTLSR